MCAEKQFKIFVSTMQTQGQRPNDFCYVPEWEPVMPPVLPCTGEEPDGKCGCARSMGGLRTLKATTTMKVVLLAITVHQLEAAIHRSLETAGWTDANFEGAGIDGPDSRKIAQGLINAAAAFEVGDVVEYRAGQFFKREVEGGAE